MIEHSSHKGIRRDSSRMPEANRAGKNSGIPLSSSSPAQDPHRTYSFASYVTIGHNNRRYFGGKTSSK
jgi:hypothetical protein